MRTWIRCSSGSTRIWYPSGFWRNGLTSYPEELTSEILNDLFDKIVVHAPDKSSGHRKQKIEIYYKAAGIINIADEDCVALDGRLGMQNRKKKTA